MSPSLTITTIILALLPISELRGALPYAYFNGVPIAQAYLLSVGCNALVAPLLYLFLSTFHRLFYRLRWYRQLFDRTVERARHKLEEKVERYGYLGVMLFVAVPLPITGAYTGTLGAWVLGMDWKRSCLAALGGVIISGMIVTAIILLGAGTHSIFIKNI